MVKSSRIWENDSIDMSRLAGVTNSCDIVAPFSRLVSLNNTKSEVNKCDVVAPFSINWEINQWIIQIKQSWIFQKSSIDSASLHFLSECCDDPISILSPVFTSLFILHNIAPIIQFRNVADWLIVLLAIPSIDWSTSRMFSANCSKESPWLVFMAAKLQKSCLIAGIRIRKFKQNAFLHYLHLYQRM